MKGGIISIIMGGGRGTRLHPLTKKRCKPAVPIAGKYRLVDIPISNCLNSGLNDIYLLTQYNTASLHKHIQATYQFDPFGGGFVEILSAEQTLSSDSWYQGTADAVRHNLHHFSHRKNDLFLILSGDQLYQMDLMKLIQHHKDLGAEVTIATKVMPRAFVGGLGLININVNYRIEEFIEKPEDPKVIDRFLLKDELRRTLKGFSNNHCLTSMGIYVFSGKILEEVLQGNATDFGSEILPNLIGNKDICAYPFDGYWKDIGTIGSFFEANMALTKSECPIDFFNGKTPVYTQAHHLGNAHLQNCKINQALISPGSTISHSTIEESVIGIRSSIKKGCYLKRMVLMGCDYYEEIKEKEENQIKGIPPMGIGENCFIEDTIIDKNAHIGDNVHLSPKGLPNNWKKGGLYVKDGKLIVAKGGIIPSNTILKP